MITLVVLAACLALGASSCTTTDPASFKDTKRGTQTSEPSAEFATSKRQPAPRGRDRSGEGLPVVDTTLRAVSVPLGAAGWVIGNAALVVATLPVL